MAELSSCERLDGPMGSKIFTVWFFVERVLAPVKISRLVYVLEYIWKFVTFFAYQKL